ncbi:MAG: VWA domain-containing protein [Terriglobia bacterium]
MKVALSMFLLIPLHSVAVAGQVAPSVPLSGTTDNASAQQPQPSPQIPGIHIEVRQVLVPVVVTDSKGHSVLGLRSSDFEVLEDGVEQKVVSLTSEADGAAKLFEAQPAVPASGTQAITPSPQEIGRPDAAYLVVIDTLNSEFGNFVQIRGALKKLFAEERPGSALYALVALSQNTSVVQRLTTDPSDVSRALENKQFTKYILASEQTSRAQQEAQLRRMLEDYCQKCPCGEGKCSTGPAVQEIESFAASAGEEHAHQLQDFLERLRGLVEQLGTVSGKRTIVLVSDGFTIQPGRDLFELIAIYLGDPKIALHDPTARVDSEMDAVLRLADSFNVVFYTVDSRGVYVMPQGGYDVTGPSMSSKTAPRAMPEIQGQKTASAVEKNDGLRELAEATGGLFFGNSNDSLKGMRRAFADGRQYYVLAYNSTNQISDRKYRTIKVQVKGKILMVRAKSGYWPSARSNTVAAATSHPEPGDLAVPAARGNIPMTTATTDAGLGGTAPPAPAANIPTTAARTYGEPEGLSARAPAGNISTSSAPAHAELRRLALFDREALRGVRTFCVDTSYLQAEVASDIKTFVAKENQPRRLLKHLNWQLVDQCAAADAVIRIYFAHSESYLTVANKDQRGGTTSSDSVETVTQVVLLVYDRASVRLLYRTEVKDRAANRVALLKSPFSKLVKDVKAIGG